MQAESLTLYFAEIRRTPLLTAADEVALGLRIRDGDADALTRMVQANLQFVVMIAKQYARFGLPIEDLIAEGNLMLYHAARKYDPTRGVRFASYAGWWIRQALTLAIRHQVPPVHVAGNAAQIYRAMRDASEAEIEAMRAEDRATLELAITAMRAACPLGEAYIEDRSPARDPEADDLAEHRSRVLDRLLARLDEKSRLLVRARFGLDGLPPRQHKDISAEIGISANWAGQLEQRAMAKLRMLAQREGIRFEDVA
jgi:RNA polymerase primary sigma factor